jgi:hypothetical protein
MHAGSGTSIRTERNLRNGVLLYQRFLRDERLRPYRGLLMNTLGIYYGKLAACVMARGRKREGWRLACRAVGLLRRPKNLAALAWNLGRAWAESRGRAPAHPLRCL